MFDYNVRPNILLSEIACSHCQVKYGENRSIVIPELTILAQDVRNMFTAFYGEDVTVHLTGYRCPEHNTWLYGEYKEGRYKNLVDPNSRHTLGLALDIKIKHKGTIVDPEIVNRIIYACAKLRGYTIKTTYKGYLNSSRHVHVSMYL